MKTEPVFAKSDILSLFPSFVWIAEFEPSLSDKINGTIIRQLDKARSSVSPPPNGQGWQSAQDLHEQPDLEDLVNCIHKLTRNVLAFSNISYTEFEITACWINVLPAGAEHKMHSHPNNFLSGAYYVRTTAGGDSINFHDPRAQTGIIRPPVSALTGGNTDQVVVTVSSGTLLLFPAWLPHSVDVNESEEERISVSFNIMFSAYTEMLSKPLWRSSDGAVPE